MTHDELIELLFSHQDVKYADFTAKLIPNIPRGQFIGIRAPEYKKIINVIKNDVVIEEFMSSLPHSWHEENMLHAALINRIKDFDECIRQTERFLPYINNWAVNDTLNPAVFNKHHAELTGKVQEWISSESAYTRRFGLHILMAHFLGEDFKPEYLELPASLRSCEYYVNMMTAWFFAEALAKQWDSAIAYIEQRRLDKWTHNKAIQKARESFRITDDKKAYLKTLKYK